MAPPQAALKLLSACARPEGLLASTTQTTNYRRVWARDGIITGLLALPAEDEQLTAGLAATLRTLAAHRGPVGQIPSNVDPVTGAVSYGGKAGRVDATLWFLVGTCAYARLCDDDALLEEQWPALTAARWLVRAWEFNDRGLLYVPRAGDWADESALSGYLLYDQALRVWAEREMSAAAARRGLPFEPDRRDLAGVLASSFWPTEGRPAYDERLLAGHRRADRSFFLAGFEPAFVSDRFCGLGNALCVLLGLGEESFRRRALDHASQVAAFDLTPALHPAIEPDEPEYALLENAAAEELRNTPGRYHNGGLWPFVTGFWALAARALDDEEKAAAFASGIARANALEGGRFPEFLDARTGEPGGTPHMAWSAAAEVASASSGFAARLVLGPA